MACNLEFLSKKNISLDSLISPRKISFPSSGEINFQVTDPLQCIKVVEDWFVANAELVDRMDGLSMSFKDWRFNLRSSNTEPLLRLNVEAKNDRQLLNTKIKEITELVVRS